jgi:hypothetical protein
VDHRQQFKNKITKRRSKRQRDKPKVAASLKMRRGMLVLGAEYLRFAALLVALGSNKPDSLFYGDNG